VIGQVSGGSPPRANAQRKYASGFPRWRCRFKSGPGLFLLSDVEDKVDKDIEFWAETQLRLGHPVIVLFGRRNGVTVSAEVDQVSLDLDPLIAKAEAVALVRQRLTNEEERRMGFGNVS